MPLPIDSQTVRRVDPGGEARGRVQDRAALGGSVPLHAPARLGEDVPRALLWSHGDTTAKHAWNKIFLGSV